MENTKDCSRSLVRRVFQASAVGILFLSLGFLFFARPELFADPQRVLAIREYPLPPPENDPYNSNPESSECFPVGTLIRAPSGEKPIETLRVGDEVVGVDPAAHETRVQRVASLHKSVKSHLYDLAFASGRRIVVSKGHPFAVWDDVGAEFSFVQVQNLAPGMKAVLLEDGEALASDEIVSMREKDEPTVVYNLSVSPDRTYVANGILVHNKLITNGTPNYRDGSYWSDGSWHCPGGGGGTATSCSGGGGWTPFVGGGPVVQPTPAGTGTIVAYALATSSKNAILGCASLVALKACLDSPSVPETAECAAFMDKQHFLDTVFYANALGGETYTKQTSADGVTFIAPSNTYYTMMAINPNAAYTGRLYCYKNSADDTYTANSKVFLKTNDTVTLLVGFAPPYPWLQVNGGGNTYAETLTSLMQLFNTPTLLYDTTTPSTPGILSVEKKADLWDFPDPEALGYANVSSKNWSTNNAQTPRNWYAFFTQRLTDITKLSYPPLGTNDGAKPSQPSSTPYAVYTTRTDTGLTTIAPWIVPAGEKLIMIVNGDLALNHTVTIAPGGFLAFIVKGTITVGSDVGTTATSTTPVIEGVYIAGGEFKTGSSTSLLKERFVGKGIFAANTILTQRSLERSGNNASASADLFLYNPELLFTMPAPMEDNPYLWQEVSP